MKQTKKIVVAALVALTLALCVVCAFGCGSTVTLPEGTYTGTYTCEYTVGETSKWGYTAEFDVDENNYIWDLELTNPDGYSGSIGARPWDLSKFTEQFSGQITVDDLMKVSIKLNESGYPDGTDCITCEGAQVNALSGFEANCAIAILAMQDAVNNALAE